jgi:hypothetical protein
LQAFAEICSMSAILLASLSFFHPWPVLMIVVYDNWMAVGSAILHMRVITWKIFM